jgi:hypothetical protein
MLPTIISITSMTTRTIENFDIVLKSKWQELGSNVIKHTDFGGKWVLVGSITFKKRSKDPIFVDEINLCWHGEKLDNLIGSLYKKNLGKDFLAIEDNLICDGIWNEKKQTLILDFDEKENLGPTTIFYLVLTVPESIEPILKKGHFCLENNCLPHPFKQCAQNEKLLLAINDSPSKGITH